MADKYKKDLQYAKFSAYGFLKNLKLFEPFLILFLLEKNLTVEEGKKALIDDIRYFFGSSCSRVGHFISP